MSVFGVLLWLPTDSLEIHVIKGTWEATHFNWCALRFIFKTFTFSFDDLILRGSLISNNHSTANLFLPRKWEALGLGWQGAEQLWATDRLSLLLLSSFHNTGEPPTLGQLQCWQTKWSLFFSTRGFHLPQMKAQPLPRTSPKGRFSSFSLVTYSQHLARSMHQELPRAGPWCLWCKAEKLQWLR